MHFKLTKEDGIKLLKRFNPWTNWLLNYKIADLRYDIIAGATVGLTIVPQCMAYAQLCSINPQYGLYSGFLAQLIYVVIGTSKDASVGPSAIISMMLAQVNSNNPLAKTGDPTYVAILSMLSGIILLLMAIFKLNFIVNLFSIPVISAFTTASGFSIFVSQLKPFFGLTTAASNDMPGVFVKQIMNVFENLHEIKTYDVIFGCSSLAFILFMQYLPLVVEKIIIACNRSAAKQSSGDEEKPPGDLTDRQRSALEILRFIAATRNVIVFVFATLAAYLVISADPSVEGKKLTVAGSLKPGFPVPTFPAMKIVNTTKVGNKTVEEELKGIDDIFSDFGVAIITVPMMILLEMFAITKSLGRKNGYRIDATNELVAVGLGNFFQGFLSTFPVTISVTRGALNDQCRAKTPLGSVVSALIVMLAIGLLTETFYYIPKSALSSIIMVAAYNLIDVQIVRLIAKEYWRDLIIVIFTFVLCLFFDMAYGILICVLINMITFLRPVVRMQIHVTHGESAETEDGKMVRTTVIQLSHGMKYPSADKFIDRMVRILAKKSTTKHIIIDCRFITGVDYTGLQAIRGILLLAYQMNKHIIFANMSDRVQKKVEKIGLDHWAYVDTVLDAVKTYDADEQELERAEQQAAFEQSTEPPVATGEREEVRRDSSSSGTGIRRRASMGVPRLASFARTSHNTERPYLRGITVAEPQLARNRQARERTISTQPGMTLEDYSANQRRRSNSQPVVIHMQRFGSVSSVNKAASTKGSIGDLRDEKPPEWLKKLQKVQPHIYEKIPLTVGNFGSVANIESSSDDEENGESECEVDGHDSIGDPVDLINRDQEVGEEEAPAPSSKSAGQVPKIITPDDKDNPPRNRRRVPPSLLAIPDPAHKAHQKLGPRFSRISEISETHDFSPDESDDDVQAENSNEDAVVSVHHNGEEQQPNGRQMSNKNVNPSEVDEIHI